MDPAEELGIIEPEDQDNEPKSDPQDDVKQLVAGLQQQITTLTSSLGAVTAAVQAPRTAEPTEPKFTEVSDRMLEEALEEGDYTKYNTLQNERQRQRDYRFEQKLDALQQMGVERIGSLVKDVTKRELPHYEKYQDEIETVLQTIPPEQRMSREAHEMAYKLTMANHMDDIIKEEVSRQLETRDRPETVQPNVRGGSGTRSYNSTSGNPTIEVELPSQEALAALESKGLNPDTFAQRMGYENWAAYVGQEEQ